MPTELEESGGAIVRSQGLSVSVGRTDAIGRSALEHRANAWRSVIGSMPAPEVLEWIIGIRRPPPAASAEAAAQVASLVAAIDIERKPARSVPVLAPRKDWIVSGYRTFERQEAIWLRKFAFQGKAFERVSELARSICGGLVRPGETRWDPAQPRHRSCWGVAPLQGERNPPLPPGARSLTSEERQREILQASAAPGLSRHHWGTDFDLFDADLDPASWERGGRFWPAYVALRDEGADYGLADPFRGNGSSNAGYIQERWHWSYWPIGRGLLEFARANEMKLQRALEARWSLRPQFTLVRQRWRDYLFGVGEGRS